MLANFWRRLEASTLELESRSLSEGGCLHASSTCCLPSPLPPPPPPARPPGCLHAATNCSLLFLHPAPLFYLQPDLFSHQPSWCLTRMFMLAKACKILLPLLLAWSPRFVLQKCLVVCVAINLALNASSSFPLFGTKQSSRFAYIHAD